jgi:hypothetical protein
MKSIVGLTVKTVCSRSSSAFISRARDCRRAILVISGSPAGAPQFEQNRTLGATYAPQLEHVMNSSSLSGETANRYAPIMLHKRAEIQNEAETLKGSASQKGLG